MAAKKKSAKKKSAKKKSAPKVKATTRASAQADGASDPTRPGEGTYQPNAGNGIIATG